MEEDDKKDLGRKEKSIEQFIDAGILPQNEQFSALTFDGYVAAVHRKDIPVIPADDVFLEELTVHRDGRGYASTRLLKIPQLTPLCPSIFSFGESSLEYVNSSFLPQAFILSGGNHFRTDPKFDLFDEMIDDVYVNLKQKLKNKGRKTTPTAKIVSELREPDESIDFSHFFPDLQSDLRDYVFFFVSTKNFALNYVIDFCRDKKEDKTKCEILQKPIQIENVDDGIWKGCRTISVNLLFGSNSVVNKTNSLKDLVIDETSPDIAAKMEKLRKNFESIKGQVQKMNKINILYNFLATSLMFEFPLLFPLKNQSLSEIEVFNILKNLYLNKKQYNSNIHNVSISDQLAAIACGLQHELVSPHFFASYKKDTNLNDIDKQPLPWVNTLRNVYKNNLNNVDEGDRDQELFKGVFAELSSVLNVADNVFNADVFFNNSELYKNFLETNHDKANAVSKPVVDLKNLRLKIGNNFFTKECNLNFYEIILLHFCGNVFFFKRFVVMNVLALTQTCSPPRCPENVSCISKVETSLNKLNYENVFVEGETCVLCKKTPFYLDGRSCLCCMICQIFLPPGGLKKKTLSDFVNVYNCIFKPLESNLEYNNELTSYKSIFNWLVDSQNCNLGYFGDARVINRSRPDGFAPRRNKMKKNTDTDEKPLEDKFNFFKSRNVDVIVEDLKVNLKKNGSLIPVSCQTATETKSDLGMYHRIYPSEPVDQADCNFFFAGSELDVAAATNEVFVNTCGEFKKKAEEEEKMSCGFNLQTLQTDEEPARKKKKRWNNLAKGTSSMLFSTFWLTKKRREKKMLESTSISWKRKTNPTI